MTAVSEFDADTTHPCAQRWRIPRVTSPYPRWKYEVALCVPDPADPSNLWGVIEPTDAEAAIIGSFIDCRRAWYSEQYQRRMLEQVFDVDSGTNTVVLAKTEQGWKYRRMTHQDGLWPHWNDPERQAEFPPSPAGLDALIDHLAWGGLWSTWKAEHPMPAEEGTRS